MTAKLLVSFGNPDQDSCGEVSVPPAPKMPLTWASGSCLPSAMSVLVSVNDGTLAMLSYGLVIFFIASQVTSGDKNAAPDDTTLVQIVDGIEGGFERIDLCLQLDLALGGERHQFNQIVVGADQIADHADFA